MKKTLSTIFQPVIPEAGATDMMKSTAALCGVGEMQGNIAAKHGRFGEMR